MYPYFKGIMDNAPKKIYKFIPFFDNGNSKVNKRNIETIEEKKVWAYYANNHHGICVEYDVCNPICLYPVSYEQERNPMSVVLGNFVALSLDAVNGKRVGLKDIGLEISAIYLGKDCSIRNQNRLKGVSINLGIDLYKMRVNNQSRKFDKCFDRIH